MFLIKKKKGKNKSESELRYSTIELKNKIKFKKGIAAFSYAEIFV